MKSRIWYHLQRRVKRDRSSSLVRLKLSNGPLKENKDRVEKRKAFQTFLLHIVKFFMQNRAHHIAMLISYLLIRNAMEHCINL